MPVDEIFFDLVNIGVWRDAHIEGLTSLALCQVGTESWGTLICDSNGQMRVNQLGQVEEWGLPQEPSGQG